jgi:hypothetical protein
VGLDEHSRDGVMFGTFEVDNLHQPFIRVGIVARQRWSPWKSLAVSRGWTVVWVAEDSPTELTSSRVSFDSLSLHFFHTVAGLHYPHRWSTPWPYFVFVEPKQPFIVGYWHKNAQEKILFYFLLAPPNHSLGPFDDLH